MEGTTLTVASKASQFSPSEFSDWLDERREAVSTIVESVKDEVNQGRIEPIVGARIASCVAGSVFGYEEFHPRGMTPPAEQLLEALDPKRGLARAGSPSRQ